MLVGFLLLPTFDFKAATSGGNAAQLVLAALALFCGIVFCLQRRPYPGSRPLQALIVVWWTMLGLNLFTTLIGSASNLTDTTFDTYTRAALPYLFFGLSLSVVQAMARKGCRIEDLANPMFLLAMVSVVFHYLYAKIGLGVSTDELRWEALTPYILPSLGGFFTGLFLQKKVSPVLILLSVLTLGTILLSITRSYLLVGFSMVPAALYALWKMPSISKGAKLRRLLVVGAALFVTAFATISLIFVIRPNTFETWSQRLFRPPNQRTDPSLLQRRMNNSGVLLELKKSPYVLTFGKGFGGGYYPDYRDAPEFRSMVSDITTRESFVGVDSLPVTALLFTGIFGLLAQLAVLCFGIWHSFRGVPLQTSEPGSDGRWASWPFITLVGLFPTITTSNSFTYRGDSLVLGLIVALGVASGDRRFTDAIRVPIVRRRKVRAKVPAQNPA